MEASQSPHSEAPREESILSENATDSHQGSLWRGKRCFATYIRPFVVGLQAGFQN
jgi:hypothetical protein